ncbi:MAG: Trk system potassium transporter TrkA [Gammaproteobacteria bacterium WSBS_2016_MAG_OTU1]
MEVLILGCGRVGGETAKALVKNRCNITVVDDNQQKLLALQSLYDLRTVCGSASDPAVLRRAGGENAEIVIAVTATDEVNLVACRLCANMFDTPIKIARLRNNAFNTDAIASKDGFNISHTFSPEQIVADNICDTIKHPGCMAVHRFSNHNVVLASVRITAEGEMAGDTIGNIRRTLPEVDFRVLSVYRDHKLQVPDGSTRLFVGDDISLVIADENLDDLLPLLAGAGDNSKVMIAGGGNIGERVAREIEKNSRVKIIEVSQKRCAELTACLNTTLVLRGEAANEHILREENIAETDIYCAVTNDDEENILSAMLAKRLGAKKTISLINRPAYTNILGRLLDNLVSPAELSIGAILAHIRAGDVSVVHSLHHGMAEVIEAVIHGTAETSSVVGRAIADIKWPPGTTPGALVRTDRMLIAHDQTVLQTGDRLIVFAAGSKALKQVGKLLQVGINHF